MRHSVHYPSIYWSKIADLDVPHLYLALRRDFWHQKTRVPELSHGVVATDLLTYGTGSDATVIWAWGLSPRNMSLSPLPPRSGRVKEYDANINPIRISIVSAVNL